MARLAVTVPFLAALVFPACSMDDAGQRPGGVTEPSVTSLSISNEARTVLEIARAAARSSARTDIRSRLDPTERAGEVASATASLLRGGPANGFVRTGDEIRPQLPSIVTRKDTLESILPTTADAPVKLRAGDVAASIRLRGASASPAEVGGNGFVVYREALAGAHVLHRPGNVSEEDFVYFDHRPAEEEVAYEIDLQSGIAGVRLVSNTLELLDERGVPRVRMSPPYLVDAAGNVELMSVAVTGCSVDEDPTPSWERAWVRPSSRACTVHARWSGEGVNYPVVVDPAWVTTGSMASARYWHTSTALNNGRVLVAGGQLSEAAVPWSSAEIFDPALGVWTATGSMSVARSLHTAVSLTSGRVLVAGGWDATPEATASTELYDPSTGSWLAGGSMATARVQHAATLLTNQTALVVGGVYYDADTETIAGLSSCERYFEATNSWVSTGSLNDERAGQHMAVRLADGRVLAAGGYKVADPNTILATAELYNPAAGTWATTGSMNVGRGKPATTLLSTNKVLVAGGTSSWPFNSLATAELFDATSGTWTSTGSMAVARRAAFVTDLVGTNKTLVAGGTVGTGATASVLASTELYDSGTGTWSSTASLNVARATYAASFVGGGVLLSGGYTNGSDDGIANAEIYQP